MTYHARLHLGLPTLYIALAMDHPRMARRAHEPFFNMQFVGYVEASTEGHRPVERVALSARLVNGLTLLSVNLWCIGFVIYGCMEVELLHGAYLMLQEIEHPWRHMAVVASNLGVDGLLPVIKRWFHLVAPDAEAGRRGELQCPVAE